MAFVYYISVTTIGTIVTDFTNDVFVASWIQEPVMAWLESIGTASWLVGLIGDGIIAGVGAVLGFVPQMFVLFFLLAILEDVGYMARIAFIMDRIFRKFGLSGKSFIPVLIGTGCGVPGVMASRTIEQDRDRKMTIMTTTFIPCGAKLPIIALISGAHVPQRHVGRDVGLLHRHCRHHRQRHHAQEDPPVRGRSGRRSSWSCRPITRPRRRTCCTACGSAAGASSSAPARSS